MTGCERLLVLTTSGIPFLMVFVISLNYSKPMSSGHESPHRSPRYILVAKAKEGRDRNCKQAVEEMLFHDKTWLPKECCKAVYNCNGSPSFALALLFIR